LVMAAVVINPPRSRTLPKPDLHIGCGWVLTGTYQREAAGRSPRRAKSLAKFRCIIIKIGSCGGFWKAALRINRC